MMLERQTRICFIDGVRGIAALMVMLMHSLNITPWMAHTISGRWIDLGESGVLAFFLVSGFVIPLSLEKYGHIGRFWLNRAFRIYPLYIAVYIATIAIVGLGNIDSRQALLKNILAHLLFVQNYVGTEDFVGGSWTLSLEAVWYCGCTGLFLLSLHRRLAIVMACAAGFSALGCALALSNTAHVPLGRIGLLISCLLGLTLYRYHKGAIRPRATLLMAAMLLGIIAIDLFVGFYLRPGHAFGEPSYRCVMLSWTVGFMTFTIPFLSRHAPLWRNRVIGYFGEISYSIYLVHGVVRVVAARLDIDAAHVVLFIFGATILISTATYRYIERPAMIFARNIYRRAPDASLVS